MQQRKQRQISMRHRIEVVTRKMRPRKEEGKSYEDSVIVAFSFWTTKAHIKKLVGETAPSGGRTCLGQNLACDRGVSWCSEVASCCHPSLSSFSELANGPNK